MKSYLHVFYFDKLSFYIFHTLYHLLGITRDGHWKEEKKTILNGLSFYSSKSNLCTFILNLLWVMIAKMFMFLIHINNSWCDGG